MEDKIEISVDRVEKNENINNCTCSICQNIYYKPVMCRNCENHFCSSCIDEWILNHPGACPFCKNFDKKKQSILLNNILDKLKISCEYKDNGCNEILYYESLLKHQARCVFSMRRESKYDKFKKLNSSVQDPNNENESSFYNTHNHKKDLNMTYSNSFDLKKKSKDAKDHKDSIDNDNDNNDNIVQSQMLDGAINRYLKKDHFAQSNFNKETKEQEHDINNNICNKSEYNSFTIKSNEIPCKVVLLGESGKLNN